MTLSFTDPATGLAADAITCTPNHPLYAVGEGWTPAGMLSVGAQVVTRAGPPLAVSSVRRDAGQAAVYNFTVEADHSYFVGNALGGVWVHNYDPLDIHFSQAEISPTFQRTPNVPEQWRGRPISDAIEEAQKLGRLPDGLNI